MKISFPCMPPTNSPSLSPILSSIDPHFPTQLSRSSISPPDPTTTSATATATIINNPKGGGKKIEKIKMPSKLKKAIAAVKDQTSISLAKVGAGGESSSLEVAILKATTHDETPVEERHVTEVLQRVSSNKVYAGPCARAIGRRVGRTRSWVVAVKSLMLVLRIFQDGDPHFPKEVYNAMKRGYKILNLSSFRDDSSASCPWDFTAFVRTFALYLDERLDCFLTGKLQRRTVVNGEGYARRKNESVVRDMKPSKLLERISHWQKLLDRAIATRPTGAARKNRLVQTCLYAIVQETFDLYRDISDGLALLLDSFFHLQYNNCTSAYQTCVKASKQFEELCSFYELCKSIGVGRISEYPCVNRVSEELLDTLQEFLKDQSSFPSGANGRSPVVHPPLAGPLGSPEGGSSRGRAVSEFGESSLEDLMSADAGFSPERYSDPGGEKPSSQMEEFLSANDTASVRSDPTDNRGVNSVLDLLSLDDRALPPESNDQDPSTSSKQGWELVLFETAAQPANVNVNTAASTSSSSWTTPEPGYNPFLHDPVELNGPRVGQITFTDKGGTTEDDLFEAFSAQASRNANAAGFPSGSFSADFGLDIGNFPPAFKANFGNTDTNSNPSFSAGFSADFGIENSSIVPPTFRANSSNNTTNDSNGNKGDGLLDLFGDLGNATANVNSAPKLDHPFFGSGNLSTSPDFLDNLGNATANANCAPKLDHPNANNAPKIGAPDFGSGNLSPSPAFLHNAGNATANASNAPKLDHPGFGGENLSPSLFVLDNFGNAHSNAGIQALPPSSTGEYSNGVVRPTFVASSEDASANAMNALVPYGYSGNDDLFSPAPTFRATPTFHATGSEFDSGLEFEDDPFGDSQKTGGALDQQSVLQQQQLWLQNQNKIMAKSFDMMYLS